MVPLMECPDCQSDHIRKNGHRRGKQNYLCLDCGRQFVANPTIKREYSDNTRRLCLRMYVNGMGFRGIERVTGVHHTTVITWVKQIGSLLRANAYSLNE
ncbi:MAG: IS1 family transposase [Leptolyngbya sp. SIO1D8]|nr:IS1 family transposase [Leptolyngbya sp. SIO1D8]